VQVRRTEGIASHSGTESCVGIREGIGEALTGEPMGQPLSRVKPSFRVPTRWTLWKATRAGALLRAPVRPGEVDLLVLAHRKHRVDDTAVAVEPVGGPTPRFPTPAGYATACRGTKNFCAIVVNCL